jgi:hypothetical protein
MQKNIYKRIGSYKEQKKRKEVKEREWQSHLMQKELYYYKTKMIIILLI